MKENSLPKRAYQVTVTVGADTWSEAVARLHELAEHVDSHGPDCQSIGGSPTAGHMVIVEHDAAMNHERYFEKIEEWRKEQRK